MATSIDTHVLASFFLIKQKVHFPLSFFLLFSTTLLLMCCCYFVTGVATFSLSNHRLNSLPRGNKEAKLCYCRAPFLRADGTVFSRRHRYQSGLGPYKNIHCRYLLLCRMSANAEPRNTIIEVGAQMSFVSSKDCCCMGVFTL